MKTLSFQQPWATLIAMGLKDIENRTWNTEYRGRFLIHASGKKVPLNFLGNLYKDEVVDIVSHQQFGNLPDDIRNLPYSSIIGYVDLEDVVKPGELTGSAWDNGIDLHRWKLKNAYLFDEPITDVKGKLNFFDYPDIDENKLPPAHKFVANIPQLIGKNLVVPVDSNSFDIVAETRHLNIDDRPGADYCENLWKDEENLKDIDMLTVICTDGRIARYKFKEAFFSSLADENGDEFKSYSLYSKEPDNMEPLYVYAFDGLELIN